MLISTHRVKANRSAAWRGRSPGGRSTINPALCGDTTLAHQNHFVWYELMTTDADAATAFYRDVVGWGAEDSGHPDLQHLQYTLLTVGGTPVSGLMALCAEAGTAGARPGWIGYVGVDDVEAFASRVKEAGGAILRGPIDLPVGRFANVADPQGAPFILFKPSRAEPRETPAHGTPGVTGWHEVARH